MPAIPLYDADHRDQIMHALTLLAPHKEAFSIEMASLVNALLATRQDDDSDADEQQVPAVEPVDLASLWIKDRKLTVRLRDQSLVYVYARRSNDGTIYRWTRESHAFDIDGRAITGDNDIVAVFRAEEPTKLA